MQTIDQMDLYLGFKLVSDYQSYLKSLVLNKVGWVYMEPRFGCVRDDLGPCMQNDEDSDPNPKKDRKFSTFRSGDLRDAYLGDSIIQLKEEKRKRSGAYFHY